MQTAPFDWRDRTLHAAAGRPRSQARASSRGEGSGRADLQPAPRARQQSAPAKPDFAPPSTQRNAEAKLAEALWPEAEQGKGQGRSGCLHRTVAVAVGVVVLCAGLGAGGYMMYILRSHAQQHSDT